MRIKRKILLSKTANGNSANGTGTAMADTMQSALWRPPQLVFSFESDKTWFGNLVDWPTTIPVALGPFGSMQTSKRRKVKTAGSKVKLHRPAEEKN